MGYVIEISEHKLDKATEYAEKMLKYGGMLMQCLSEWEEEAAMETEAEVKAVTVLDQ